MRAFMTSGTYQFLKKLEDKYPNIRFYFMKRGTSTLSYYEEQNRKKSIFVSGRSYEVLISEGHLQDKGYIIMNNIPVAEEGQPVFEDRFKNRNNAVSFMPGFQAFRLLKPLKGNTYVVLTQWRTEKDYQNWKDSEEFKQAHQQQSTKPPAYFLEQPFITDYIMIVENEEKTNND